MEGYADSVQLDHSAGPPPDRGERDAHLLFSPEAEQRGQTPFGLQTWNSIRAVDFVCSLDDVDKSRIAVTGASGGGTQSMILGAVDDRVDAVFPAVMVSTAMQGGCTCENAAYLRIGQGNVDIAAAIAPRPLGLTAADDWTKELETKGHPDLVSLYRLLGHPGRYEAHFHVEFKHNYNAVNRQHMYSFINRAGRAVDNRNWPVQRRSSLLLLGESRFATRGDQSYSTVTVRTCLRSSCPLMIL